MRSSLQRTSEQYIGISTLLTGITDACPLGWLAAYRVLVCKRLERGRFTRPQSGDAQGKVILSHEELSVLLGGIDLTKTKHKRWFRKASPVGHAAA